MAIRERVRPRDVLGVPVIPPASASVAGSRLRRSLRKASDLLAPPPVHVLEALFGSLDHRVLVVLCDIGVPDALDRSMALSALGARVDADPVNLERLVRYASARRWLRLDRRGRVHPTSITRFLRHDHPGGWRAWVDFAGGDEVSGAIAALSGSQTSSDCFAAANGLPFFEWMAAHPQRWATFDEAMAAGARMHALALLDALDWEGTRSICDVGGGTGALAAALLDVLPTATATVLDLEAVVARAVAHQRLDFVAGDAFVEVPDGHDTYLLVNVIHDWGDEDAIALLRRVGEAAGPARIIVVDADHPAVPRELVATAADVLMAALTGGGRERSAAQLATLAHAAGLELTESTRLASGDWAHELRGRPRM